MKIIILFVLTLILASPMFSQTGPGGVGSTDGTSNLEIWLTASDLNGDGDLTNNPTNGTSVSAWVDKSGNLNNFTQTGTNRPTYTITGVFNSVNFNASLATAQFMNGSTSGQYTDGSVFFALNPINDGSSNTLFDNNQTSLRIEQWNNTGVVGYTRYGVGDYTSTISSVFGVNSIYSYHKTGASASIDIRVNGITQNVALGNSGQGIPYDNIGKNTNGADESSGDFFEVLLFSSRLNTAQIIIVENYLSAKYAGISIPTDVYDEDNAGNGNYDFEVAGIGQASDGSNHTDAQGTGIVRINSPSNLDNDEYLIWGHDNGIQKATETADVPVGVQARFDRVWRASEVNTSLTAVNVGNIDIRWDLTGLGSVTSSDLRLLIDTDNDGVFTDETIGTGGIILGATLIGGNIYQFTGVSGIANNLRFTLGTINSSETPLPIELINFTVSSLNSKHAQLDWQTASESNNDYFTIERSQNGMDWESLKTINGTGNSLILLNYSAIDYDPYTGISYYRLKQTDFDGQFSFSNIRSVKIDNLVNVPIKIYPNPTDYQITITGNAIELETVNVYNIFGKNVTKSVIIKINNNQKTVLDLSELSSGVYFIKTKTTANKVYKQ